LRVILVFIGIVFYFSVFSSSNRDTLFIDDSFTYERVLQYTSYFSDTSKTLTIENLQKFDDKFRDKPNNNMYLFSYDKANHWVKINIKNKSSQLLNLLFDFRYKYPYQFSFYEITNKSIKSLPVDYHKRLSTVSFKPNETKVLVVKTANFLSSLRLGMDVYTPSSYIKQSRVSFGFHTFFIGVCFLAILLAVFLYALNKESIFLLYTFYVCSITLGILNTEGWLWFLHDINRSFFSIHMRPILMALLCSSTLLFIRSFFKSPKLDKIMLYAFWGMYLGVFLTMLLVSDDFKHQKLLGRGMNIVFLVLVVLVFTKLIIGLRKRNFLSRAYLITSIPLYLSFICIILSNNRLFPFELDVNLMIVVAVLIEVIGLSGVISYQVQRNFKEKRELTLKHSEMLNDKTRISRDLHDNLGSQLVYISSYIDNLRYDQPQLKDTLSELHTYTKSTITELRNAIWVMDKEDITLLILAKRIALYLSSLRSIVGNIEIIFKNQITTDQEIKFYEALNMIRIVQEAINNAVKHAESTNITITFNNKEIIVKDNGKGFDQSSVKKGYGINNMVQRAQDINKELIISANETGTKIHLKL